jgi:site-specific DNA recombinase
LDRDAVRCAVYTRRSRDSAQQLSSCEVQRECCEDLIAEHSRLGWVLLDDRYDDPEGSSETLQRPAMQRLLADIAAGRIDRVVVTRMERVTRRLRDLGKFTQFLEQYDVQFSVVTDPHFGGSAANRLMSNVIAAAAEFELELIRERMAESRAALKRKGRRVAGRVPYGYVVDETTRQLVVHEEEANNVHLMFEWAAEGMRPSQIADVANERGWRTRGATNGSDGGPWTARQVVKLLSNPTYAGWIRNGDGVLPGRHEPIVSRELFEQVREVIASRRPQSSGLSKSPGDWPLRGILTCGRCGRGMSPSVSRYKNRIYPYYRCRSTAGGRPPCRGVCISAYEIEMFIRSTLASNCCEGTVTGWAPEFITHWQELNEREQIARLRDVLTEVVFAPDEGTITLMVAEDAGERLKVI